MSYDCSKTDFHDEKGKGVRRKKIPDGESAAFFEKQGVERGVAKEMEFDNENDGKCN